VSADIMALARKGYAEARNARRYEAGRADRCDSIGDKRNARDAIRAMGEAHGRAYAFAEVIRALGGDL
jgi:ribosomal protein S8E